MARDEVLEDLMVEVPVLRANLTHMQEKQDKHDELLSKIVESNSLLSQRVVGIEERASSSDHLLKWILGTIATTFAAVVALLIQFYLK